MAACLAEIAQVAKRPNQMALVLRAYAEGSHVGRDTSEAIDLVVSGPDPSEAARDTGVVMRQLFKTARKRVLAVGFAVHQGREIFEELANRLDEEEGPRGHPVHRRSA